MPINGLTRTYDQSLVIREQLENVISMISPAETPLFALLNRKRVYNTKVEWLEDSLRGMSSILRSAVTGSRTIFTVGATGTAEGAAKFPISTNYPILLRLGEELVLATARTSNVITVTRKYNAVTAAHAAGTRIEILADLNLEGADAPRAFSQNIERPFNYTQIFHETVHVSGTQAVLNLAGAEEGEMDYQTTNRLLEMKIQLERALISGYRNQGSTATYRTMGGLHMFITTNRTNAGGSALSEAMIQDDLKRVYDAGGRPGIILCNSTQAQRISNLYAGRITTNTPEDVLGGVHVPRIIDPVGGAEVAIVVDRWVPQHEYYVLTPDKLYLAVLREFAEDELAKTGDAVRKHIVGEYSLMVMSQAAHARRFNLAV